jgi:hypothetical protein
MVLHRLGETHAFDVDSVPLFNNGCGGQNPFELRVLGTSPLSTGPTTTTTLIHT